MSCKYLAKFACLTDIILSGIATIVATLNVENTPKTLMLVYLMG